VCAPDSYDMCMSDSCDVYECLRLTRMICVCLTRVMCTNVCMNLTLYREARHRSWHRSELQSAIMGSMPDCSPLSGGSDWRRQGTQSNTPHNTISDRQFYH